MNEIYKTAEQIEFAELKKASGWKAVRIAEELNLSEGAVSKILSGQRNPGAQTLELFRIKTTSINSEKNLEHSLDSGVSKSESQTKRVVLPSAGREKVFSTHEQPGGKQSDDLELNKALSGLEYLRHVDPLAFDLIKNKIEICEERARHESQHPTKKKK